MITAAEVLAVAGPVAIAGGWLVVRRGVSLWVVNGTLLPVLGALAVLSGRPTATGGSPVGGAILCGALAGVALYGATALFLRVAGRWPPLARHTAELYDNRSEVSFATAFIISVALAAPAEELLWRGVVLPVLQGWTGSAIAAAAVSWLVYVGANAVNGSVPIVLGAVVGGAVWTVLAFDGGGVAACMACHMAWTGLMVAVPPIRRTP